MRRTVVVVVATKVLYTKLTTIVTTTKMVDMTISGAKPPILVPGSREPGGVGRPNRYLANRR